MNNDSGNVESIGIARMYPFRVTQTTTNFDEQRWRQRGVSRYPAQVPISRRTNDDQF